MLTKIKLNNSGVTLIETIIALSILTVGIVASLTLMISSISFSQSSEQMIVVVNLAREGVEATRSIRDLDGFSSLSNGSYIVDVDGDLTLEDASFSGGETVENCTNCYLYLNDDRYLHTGQSDEETIFKRLIVISSPQSYEKKIISQVYWVEHGREHTFKLESHITDY